MAQPVLPSPANFLAVALVIKRSRDGPNFVFHYPPRVQPPRGHQGHNESGDNDDILLERLNEPAESLDDPVDSSAANDLFSNWDEHQFTESGTQIVPWEHVAGFPTKDLASILTPARSYHKKLFQLSLDPLYCVSYPIHVPEAGSWKKKKKKDKPRKAKSAKTDDTAIGPLDPEPTAAETSNDADADAPESKDKEKEEEDDKRASMTMFNLVFILHPKKHEVKELVSTLYFNIIKKLNKAYKYSQQHSDFVWKESKRIIAMKDKAREEKRKMSSLWAEIIISSSLAASIQDIYEAVSQNKIAALQLDTAAGALTPSVQIPIPFHVSDLPPEGEEGQRGLWLTTANSLISDDAFDEPGFLDRNFGLLLMEDEKKIIAELQTDSDPATAHMIEFVRLSKPTQSFYQAGQGNTLSLTQVRKFAQHFIFWRRAIAIPPLHMRDVYILSPNSNTALLPRASLQWQKTFPLAPPLANFLAELSFAPRPYKHFCPGKPHRPTYLLMLAWLMRGGWVTQLCSFAYVVVWPEIMYEVDYELEAEELRRSEDAALGTSAPSSTTLDSPDERHESSDGILIGSATSFGSAEDSNGRRRATSADSRQQKQPQSPQKQPHIPTMNEQVAEQARLERIAEKTQREATEKAAAHARKVPPTATDRPSTNDAPHLAHLTPHIILDAKKATGKESLYLSAIGRRFKDEKVRKAWQAFWKYFNGQSALERIALQEDMKRKEAWALLMAMSDYLICVRHW
ncbi:nitrogen permease regulator of amino acid transport activity 3-domain-containing protein [Plectosphaerella cucumerina]|uniref:Nitrogen permease regulator 3 n=1 Tax=Plectosphaerella cucumerina TaxID=40658 RepID=A0A8K0X6P4_9PEZI|nr:nitrogen permease regulator of amino acid transport activity 3-domain-containing protein [Plectosphaerella cucumerina]